MNSTIVRNNVKSVSSLFTLSAVLLGLSLSNSALAAAPQNVNYKGAAVTTAVPGTPFNINFQVKNTGDTSYSDIKVIYHIPDELTISKVSPANSDITDNIVSWSTVPLEKGQSFYPSFTLTMASDTPLKTKLNIWVQVTGKDMEETSKNFSITAKAKSPVTTSTLSSTDVTNMFMSVYGHTPTTSELKYWVGRRADKPGRVALLGAMGYQKTLGIQH